MKKTLMMAVAVLLFASGANAVVLVADDFSYADGPLVGNGGWVNHSGTPGDLLVADGQAVADMTGGAFEDGNLAFAATSGDLYYAFDFSVDDLGTPYVGSDNEYFAHFKDAASNFAARMDIVESAAGGDFSVGISSDGSTADVAWPTGLSYATVYRVVVRYSQTDNIAQLWIDPTTPGDASITGNDQPDPGDAVVSFALRQSGSSMDETVRVDNLVVGTACDDFFADCPVAIEAQSWGAVKSLYR